MERAVRRLNRRSQPFQSDGIVVQCGADGIRVDTDQGECVARRALSCLVEPVAGDRVLVAGDLGDEIFVIAVLKREDTSAIRIAVEGDLSVGVPKGRFSIAAASGVDLVSAAGMGFTAAELTVRAPKGRIFLDTISCLARRVFAEMESVKMVGGFFDAVFARLSQKVRRSYRVVEEIDHVRSSQIDYRATKNMSLRGQNTLVTAKELVKLDGDQIHLG